MKPKVIEILGVAGTGKTTITNELIEISEEFSRGIIPSVRKLSTIPFFIISFFKSFPLIVHLQQQTSRRFSKREIAWLMIIRGWPRILSKDKKKIILLDQGPIFLIASIIGLNPDDHKEKVNIEPWKYLVKYWSNYLDEIIYLDAYDEDLFLRIANREKDHLVKGKSTIQQQEFIDHNREIFRTLMDLLLLYNPKIKIRKFNTSLSSPQELITEITSLF